MTNEHEHPPTVPAYALELADELIRRQSKNPKYSLRAFARDLGVHASDLSKVLTGKRLMAIRTAIQLVKHLDWDEPRKRRFLDGVVDALKARAFRDAGLSGPD